MELLKDGKLYETKHGARFRVTKTGHGIFECRSYGGHWDEEGRAHGKVWINSDYRKPHLVKEIDECRWIPARRERWASTPNHLRCSYGKHHQVLVDLEYAKQIGQEGHRKGVEKRIAAAAPAVAMPAVAVPAKSGEVRFQDSWGYTCGFNWKFIDVGNFLEITTTLGDVIKVHI